MICDASCVDPGEGPPKKIKRPNVDVSCQRKWDSRTTAGLNIGLRWGDGNLNQALKSHDFIIGLELVIPHK